MDKTILIVAASTEIRNDLSALLTAEGCITGNASTSGGALYVLEQFKDMNCMLLEENITEMSMDKFLSQVKGITPKIFIVAISDSDKLPEWAQKLGVKNFLKKPFVLNELRKVLSACVSESGTKLMSA